MISTRFVGLVIDTVVCLTLVKWEIVSGRFGGYLNRTDNPRIIAYAQRLVTLTDWIFTAGGVAFLVVGAYGMALVAGLDLRGTTWLVWGQLLLAISGLIWVLILIPTQSAQARQARVFDSGGLIPDSYWRHNRRWVIWGVIATLVPMANLYFMVFKP